MNTLPRAARYYVKWVILCGAALSLYAALGHRVSDIWNLLLMIILGCQMATVKVRLRFGGETCTLSMAFPFVFATLLHFGLSEAIMVALCCATSQCLFNTLEKPPLYRTLFSAAAFALSAAASGAAYALCEDLLSLPMTHAAAVAPLAGVVTFWLVNIGLVSGAMSLSAQESFWRVETSNLKCTAANFAIGGALAVGLVYLFRTMGIGIFVASFPFFYLMHYAYTLVLANPLGRPCKEPRAR